MGLLGGIARTIAERSAQNPGDIETVPGVNKYSGQQTDIARPKAQDPFLVDLIRTLSGTTTSTAANRIGAPAAAGLDRGQVSQLLQEEDAPMKKALQTQQVQSGQSLEQYRKDEIDLRRQKLANDAAARAKLALVAKDPLFDMANANMNKLIATNPLAAFEVGTDPQKQLDLLNQQLSILRSAKGNKPKLPPPVGGPKTGAPAPAGKSLDGKIRVTRISDGASGTIDEADFDPKIYRNQ